MKPINFPESNKTLLKPKDMTDDECGSLPVFCNGKECVSLWELTWKEVLQVLIHRHIWVYVFSGHTQPPISLSTEKTVFINRKSG
jgi:hypothetical protein